MLHGFLIKISAYKLSYNSETCQQISKTNKSHFWGTEKSENSEKETSTRQEISGSGPVKADTVKTVFYTNRIFYTPERAEN